MFIVQQIKVKNRTDIEVVGSILTRETSREVPSPDTCRIKEISLHLIREVLNILAHQNKSKDKED